MSHREKCGQRYSCDYCRSTFSTKRWRDHHVERAHARSTSTATRQLGAGDGERTADIATDETTSVGGKRRRVEGRRVLVA
jgi:hypothetical protein